MHQRLIPTLHHLEHSAAFRCLWALEELREANGIVYKLKNYLRRTGAAPPELKELFQLGKSPILTLESTAEGEAPPTVQLIPGVLTEAQLIIRFLSDEYGNGLWQQESEADKKRETFFQAFAMMSLASKIDFPTALEAMPAALPFGFSHLYRLILYPMTSYWIKALQPIFQVLEDALSEQSPWFSGSKFGLADFDVCWCIDTASQRGYFDPARFPKTGDWYMKVKGRGGYQRALEKGNGYDLKTFGM